MMKQEVRLWATRALSAIGLFLLLSPGQAIAQAKDDSFHWQIGVGAGGRPDYEGSNDYEPFPVAFLRLDWARGQHFYVRGTESSGAAVRLEGNVLPSNTFEFGPVLQYRPERNDMQSGRVDAMSTVDGAVELGGFVSYKIEKWLMRTTVVADASDEHGGTLVELVGGYAHRYESPMTMELHVASTWASDGYMRTYFGVDGGDALRSGFDTYDADSGFKDVGTRLLFGWGDHTWGPWRLYALFSYFRLIGDTEDSPLVDEAGDANQFFGGLAVGYMK